MFGRKKKLIEELKKDLKKEIKRNYDNRLVHEKEMSQLQKDHDFITKDMNDDFDRDIQELNNEINVLEEDIRKIHEEYSQRIKELEEKLSVSNDPE